MGGMFGGGSIYGGGMMPSASYVAPAGSLFGFGGVPLKTYKAPPIKYASVSFPYSSKPK
jgi:hypothetical protein